MRVDREPAFVLHARPYREASQLVDFLTPNFGRVRLVARSSKKQRKLQPFAEQEASWSGKSDLKTLLKAEPLANAYPLKGTALYSGFYLNELLVRLVQESDTHLGLYGGYRQTLKLLSAGEHPEIALRQFELLMLRELGYGLVLETDALTGKPVKDNDWYWFDPNSGLQEKGKPPGDNSINWFLGSSLMALHRLELNEPQVRRDAKRLLRLALKPLLGDKPIHSRELFSSRIIGSE